MHPNGKVVRRRPVYASDRFQAISRSCDDGADNTKATLIMHHSDMNPPLGHAYETLQSLNDPQVQTEREAVTDVL